MRLAVLAVSIATFVAGCGDAPSTSVVFDNHVSAVVYRARWLTTTVEEPILPGQSSPPASALAASENTAYVLLAPGWDPATASAPEKVVALMSRRGFAVHLDTTLRIPIDDATFAGNCAPASVFADDLDGYAFDVATCTGTRSAAP